MRSAAEALDATLFRVFSNVASLIATVGVMARLSPFVTLLACIVVPVLMIPARYENGYFYAFLVFCKGVCCDFGMIVLSFSCALLSFCGHFCCHFDTLAPFLRLFRHFELHFPYFSLF